MCDVNFCHFATWNLMFPKYFTTIIYSPSIFPGNIHTYVEQCTTKENVGKANNCNNNVSKYFTQYFSNQFQIRIGTYKGKAKKKKWNKQISYKTNKFMASWKGLKSWMGSRSKQGCQYNSDVADCRMIGGLVQETEKRLRLLLCRI